DTIGGVFIARCLFPCSLSLSLFVAILFLLCFLKRPVRFALKNSLNLLLHTARIPPVDPAPATITAVLAMHAGHICPSSKLLIRQCLSGDALVDARCEPLFTCFRYLFRHRLSLLP